MKFIFNFLFTISIFSGYGQSSEIGDWFIYFGNQKISNKWNWHNEIQFRNYNILGDIEQLLLRTGIGYNLTENNNNVLLGYAYIHSRAYISGTYEKSKTNEYRIFQQFITRQTFGRYYINHRYRVEERFINDNFSMRFRYFLGLNIAINKKEMAKNTLYFSTYSELFINNKTTVFDRDRVYGALGFCINKLMRVELGVMSQILNNKSRTQFQVVFFNNLPFKKEE